MYILVFDAEDYGVRFHFRDIQKTIFLSGGIRGIGTEATTLMYAYKGERARTLLSEINDVTEAVQWIRDFLIEQKHLPSLNELAVIGQRIVHGGTEFKVPTVITEDVIKKLKELKDFAPVHLSFNLDSIQAVKKLFPGRKQIGVFDTAFHQTLPPKAYLYAIPFDYIKKYGIRRFGFHGISHKYMFLKSLEFSGIEMKYSRVITLHLGHGCSATAVKNGVSVDTTMGFSPLEGLIMKERSGTVNYDILSFLHNKENMSWEEIDTMLYQFSGLYGLSGGLHDMGEIISEVEKGNQAAQEAYDSFIYSIRKTLGSYALVLEGIDAVVVTGVLVHDYPKVRESIFEKLGVYGIKIDEDRNRSCVGELEGEISSASSRVKVYYVRQAIRMAIADEIGNMI